MVPLVQGCGRLGCTGLIKGSEGAKGSRVQPRPAAPCLSISPSWEALEGGAGGVPSASPCFHLSATEIRGTNHSCEQGLPILTPAIPSNAGQTHFPHPQVCREASNQQTSVSHKATHQTGTPCMVKTFSPPDRPQQTSAQDQVWNPSLSEPCGSSSDFWEFWDAGGSGLGIPKP